MGDQLIPAELGRVRLEGSVGEELDKVLAARILSEKAAHAILPEALAAFRDRVDDRIRPGQGLWQGEFWGKWVLGAVGAQRYTGDPGLREVIARSVDDLIATQRADGYIGTYADSGFVGEKTWNVWCRKYTLWGLLDAYELLGESRILCAAAGLMDHLATEVGPGKVDIVRTGNFVGLPSCSILLPVVKLHRLTGEPRYIEYARYIVEQWSKYPGAPPDIVGHGLGGAPIHAWFPEAGAWTKAYEFISCVEGLIELYRVDNVPAYLTAARNIYEAIRKSERVITGGIGCHDKLAEAAVRPDGLNEPCDVVYWERLSLQLLRLTGDPQYADEIERLAYNVLLASMNRDGSWGLRRLALSEPHLIAPLHCLLRYHQCCVANVPRGLLQLAETAVMSAASSPDVVVNLYIPGTVTTAPAGGRTVMLKTQTDYPRDGDIRIEIEAAPPVPFTLKLRIPPWSTDTRLTVAGEPVSDVRPGTYAAVDRTWRTGDVVELHLDLRARVMPLPGSAPFAAVVRGPVVLARSGLVDSGDLHAPMAPRADTDGGVNLMPVPEAPGVDAVFEVPTADGRNIRMCDYASTGKDFLKPRDPYAWKEMIDNRTKFDLRVWLPRPCTVGSTGEEPQMNTDKETGLRTGP
ncbi:MAG: hypothetical protein GXP31_00965 [Kiritimatiellaeota bacterium]|nr:hypothetical protein [Kiritimatiellota bacterium]